METRQLIADADALGKSEEAVPWYRRSPPDALAILASSPSGLSSAEAARRLAESGPNTLTETKRVRPFAIFLAQFKNLIIWILIGAGIVSGALGEWVDSFAILAIVALNAIIGFYQEFSAEKSIAALRKMTAPRARVWRDQTITMIAASKVVPGDILELEAGDLVAADARLLEDASDLFDLRVIANEPSYVRPRALAWRPVV